MPKAATVVLALAALTLTGCGSNGPSTDGPLGGATHGSAASVCNRVGQPAVFGVETFTNTGHTTLVLDHVGIRHPHGVHLVHAVVTPGSGDVGVTRDWPPQTDAAGRRLWQLRQPVHGFRLAPRKSFGMVVAIAATVTPRGGTPGLLIYYRDAGVSYLVKDGFGMQVITGRCP